MVSSTTNSGTWLDKHGHSAWPLGAQSVPKTVAAPVVQGTTTAHQEVPETASEVASVVRTGADGNMAVLWNLGALLEKRRPSSLSDGTEALGLDDERQANTKEQGKQNNRSSGSEQRQQGQRGQDTTSGAKEQRASQVTGNHSSAFGTLSRIPENESSEDEDDRGNPRDTRAGHEDEHTSKSELSESEYEEAHAGDEERAEEEKSQDPDQDGIIRGRFSKAEKDLLFQIIREDPDLMRSFLHQSKRRIWNGKSWMHEIGTRFNRRTSRQRSHDAVRHHLKLRRPANSKSSRRKQEDQDMLNLLEHANVCAHKDTCTRCLQLDRLRIKRHYAVCGFASCDICTPGTAPSVSEPFDANALRQRLLQDMRAGKASQEPSVGRPPAVQVQVAPSDSSGVKTTPTISSAAASFNISPMASSSTPLLLSGVSSPASGATVTNFAQTDSVHPSSVLSGLFGSRLGPFSTLPLHQQRATGDAKPGMSALRQMLQLPNTTTPPPPAQWNPSPMTASNQLELDLLMHRAGLRFPATPQYPLAAQDLFWANQRKRKLEEDDQPATSKLPKLT